MSDPLDTFLDGMKTLARRYPTRDAVHDGDGDEGLAALSAFADVLDDFRTAWAGFTDDEDPIACAPSNERPTP